MQVFFSKLQTIWLEIVFFIFSIVIFGVCLYSCLFVRWVYKRRMIQKTNAMFEKYDEDGKRRRKMEIEAKRKDIPTHAKRSSSGSRVPKTRHVVVPKVEFIGKDNKFNYVVKQVNESPIAIYNAEGDQEEASQGKRNRRSADSPEPLATTTSPLPDSLAPPLEPKPQIEAESKPKCVEIGTQTSLEEAALRKVSASTSTSSLASTTPSESGLSVVTETTKSEITEKETIVRVQPLEKSSSKTSHSIRNPSSAKDRYRKPKDLRLSPRRVEKPEFWPVPQSDQKRKHRKKRSSTKVGFLQAAKRSSSSLLLSLGNKKSSSTDNLAKNAPKSSRPNIRQEPVPLVKRQPSSKHLGMKDVSPVKNDVRSKYLFPYFVDYRIPEPAPQSRHVDSYLVDSNGSHSCARAEKYKNGKGGKSKLVKTRSEEKFGGY